MSLFDAGDEAFKLAIHGASFALNVEMAAYNVIVWKKRGTAWHLISALVYASCAVLEVVQVQRHRPARPALRMATATLRGVR